MNVEKLASIVILSVTASLLMPSAAEAAAKETSQKSFFQPLIARDLLGKRIAIPQGLKCKQCCLIVAFAREQQTIIDTWSPFLQGLEKENEGFKYFEVPVIQSGYAPIRWFIDGSMARAIQSKEGKERTLTSYTNVSKFVKAMNLDEKQITLYILNDRRQVIGKVTGAYDQTKAEVIKSALSNDPK